MKPGLYLLAATTLYLTSAHADEWPQWRGPQRNGTADGSPPLLASFSQEGLRKVWSSEKIPCGENGGWGSVSIVSGRAYVYTNQNKPVGPFVLNEKALASLSECRRFNRWPTGYEGIRKLAPIGI